VAGSQPANGPLTAPNDDTSNDCVAVLRQSIGRWWDTAKKLAVLAA